MYLPLKQHQSIQGKILLGHQFFRHYSVYWLVVAIAKCQQAETNDHKMFQNIYMIQSDCFSQFPSHPLCQGPRSMGAGGSYAPNNFRIIKS